MSEWEFFVLHFRTWLFYGLPLQLAFLAIAFLWLWLKDKPKTG
jgi:hypothetical protein